MRLSSWSWRAARAASAQPITVYPAQLHASRAAPRAWVLPEPAAPMTTVMPAPSVVMASDHRDLFGGELGVRRITSARSPDHPTLVVSAGVGSVEDPGFDREELRGRVADPEPTDSERHDLRLGQEPSADLDLCDGRHLCGPWPPELWKTWRRSNVDRCSVSSAQTCDTGTPGTVETAGQTVSGSEACTAPAEMVAVEAERVRTGRPTRPAASRRRRRELLRRSGPQRCSTRLVRRLASGPRRLRSRRAVARTRGAPPPGRRRAPPVPFTAGSQPGCRRSGKACPQLRLVQEPRGAGLARRDAGHPTPTNDRPGPAPRSPRRHGYGVAGRRPGSCDAGTPRRPGRRPRDVSAPLWPRRTNTASRSDTRRRPDRLLVRGHDLAADAPGPPSAHATDTDFGAENVKSSAGTRRFGLPVRSRPPGSHRRAARRTLRRSPRHQDRAAQRRCRSSSPGTSPAPR